MIILILFGAVCGFLTMTELDAMHALDLPFWQYLLTLLGMLCILYLAFFIQIIIHEAGHLVFGLLTGYHFSSFRIGSFMWIRQNGKIRFKRFTLAGTGGQCLLVPPPLENGKIPYVLYNLGGSFLNLFSASAAVGLIFFVDTRGLLHFFLLIMCIIGAGFALTNGIPMNADGVTNDGHNARDLEKNPNALRAFWLQMKINEAQASGLRLKDMPGEWFEMPPQEDMKNIMCSTIAVVRTSRFMDQHAFTQAAESIDALLQDSKSGKIEIQGIYQHLMACDRIFCALIGNSDRSIVEKLLTKELQSILKQMKNMLSVIRTEYTLALLYEKNPEKAANLALAFDKHASKYPHPAEVQSEREFMRLVKENAEKDAPAPCAVQNNDRTLTS